MVSDIKTLSIDIETYSGYDLNKCGVYKYVEHPDFDILLFGYAVNGGEVQVVDLACGEKIPEEVLVALSDESVTKWAFNASFERVCLSMWLRRNRPKYFYSYSIEEDSVRNYLDSEAWRCSMVWSAYMGLPFSLEGFGTVLGLEEQKLKEGRELIRYFCVPCKPTKANGGRTRNMTGRSGIYSSPITGVMWKWRCRYRSALRIIRCRILYGMNTILTRRSMTGGSPLTCRWWKK